MSVSQPTAAVDLAVVGAGAVGLAVAWRAASAGLAVTVLERGEPGAGTSRVAAGMIAPIAEARPAEEPVLELGLRSARLYPGFVEDVQSAGGRRCGYTPSGTLLVARDDDEARHLERELALRERFGLAAHRLLPSAARRLEPSLTPSLRLALDVPDDHAVDPRALTAALAAAVVARGATVRTGTEVIAVRERAGRVAGVTLAGGAELDAAQVVIAAGAWSDALGVAGAPSLRPVKGQILRLHDPAGPGLLTRVVRMGPSYVVPRGDGRYVIGGTSEERGFDTTVTAGAVFELLRDASELVPGISEFVLDECAAGLRPGSADNLPAIGPGGLDGVHWAAGHGRGGILLAPVTAAMIAAELGLELEPGEAEALDGLDTAPFAPMRFAAVAAGSAS